MHPRSPTGEGKKPSMLAMEDFLTSLRGAAALLYHVAASDEKPHPEALNAIEGIIRCAHDGLREIWLALLAERKPVWRPEGAMEQSA